MDLSRVPSKELISELERRDEREKREAAAYEADLMSRHILEGIAEFLGMDVEPSFYMNFNKNILRLNIADTAFVLSIDGDDLSVWDENSSAGAGMTMGFKIPLYEKSYLDRLVDRIGEVIDTYYNAQIYNLQKSVKEIRKLLGDNRAWRVSVKSKNEELHHSTDRRV